VRSPALALLPFRPRDHHSPWPGSKPRRTVLRCTIPGATTIGILIHANPRPFPRERLGRAAASAPILRRCTRVAEPVEDGTNGSGGLDSLVDEIIVDAQE